jgi:UDP-2,3-diacylglucosamine pyrophosphatase LpxH
MLVFLSDTHLTDGTSGTTIVPAAFDKFCRTLDDIIWDPEKTNIKTVEIVLLGDIIDVIRSSLWLRPENADQPDPVRPWSDKGLVDKAGWNLRNYTEEIVDAIVNRPDNIEAVGYLKKFRDRMANKGVDVAISYIVGNHDWLINRYESTRCTVAGFLGLKNPSRFSDNRFLLEQAFSDYHVIARHGDYYDSMNYEGNRDASSLGDAIVIDLLNKFPVAVERESVLGSNQGLVDRLKEIDNVQPLLDIPIWLQGVCNEYPGVEERVHSAWNALVDEFFQMRFIRDHDRFGPDVIDLLQLALHLTSGFSFGHLKEILGSKALRYLYGRSDDYKRYAFNEAALRSNLARYVVYGHTHCAAQTPLDIVHIPGEGTVEKLYFNTGTWRKVFEHTTFDKEKCELIGWHVMTFVLFYLESEKDKNRNYEVWSNSLGQGRA